MAIMALIAAAAAILPPGTKSPGIDYFCAAPLSSDSQVRIPHPGRRHRISGRIGPVRLEDIPDPSKPIQMVGDSIPSISRGAMVEIVDDDSHATVTLHVSPRYRRADDGSIVTDIYVQTWIDGEDEDPNRDYDLTEQTHRDYRDAVRFEIVAVEDKVVVTAGGKTLELDVPLGPNAVVGLACVGGEFNFDDIEIGVAIASEDAVAEDQMPSQARPPGRASAE